MTYGKPFANTLTLTVGGGLQSAYTFGGLAPDNLADEQGGQDVQMPLPENPMTLSRAVGISSFAPAYSMSNQPTVDALIPRLDYWPVTSDMFPTPQDARKFKAGDGGNLENLALL